MPVDLDGAGDVAGFVKQHVLVRLHHHELAAVEPAGVNCRGKPLGGYQALGVGVGGELLVLLNGVGHGDGLSLKRSGGLARKSCAAPGL